MRWFTCSLSSQQENVFLTEEEERLKERDWLAECGDEYDRLKRTIAQ